MEWSRLATIGYNAAGDFHANEEPYSGAENAHTIACSSQPENMWHNVYYKVSLGSPDNATLPPTVEPCKCIYVLFRSITWSGMV